MNEHEQDLYQQVILEHNRKPRNFGALNEHTHKSEGYNPLCGDHIWVEMIIKDDIAESIHFRGDGCAICKASASMMTTSLKGLKTAEIRKKINEFKSLVKGTLNPDRDQHELGRLKIFAGIWKYPARVKCAILAWYTAEGALDHDLTVTTE